MDTKKKEKNKREQEIIALLRKFCDKKLNEEYFKLCEKLILKLGRKRAVPFMTGKTEIWAAATIHAIGSINFLFDRSFKPYVTLDDMNDFFGTKKTTTGGKSKEIRDMLKLHLYDSEFSTEKLAKSNPKNRFVMVDGMFVPIDMLPEEYQEIARQAQKEGATVSFRTKE